MKNFTSKLSVVTLIALSLSSSAFAQEAPQECTTLQAEKCESRSTKLKVNFGGFEHSDTLETGPAMDAGIRIRSYVPYEPGGKKASETSLEGNIGVSGFNMIGGVSVNKTFGDTHLIKTPGKLTYEAAASLRSEAATARLTTVPGVGVRYWYDGGHVGAIVEPYNWHVDRQEGLSGSDSLVRVFARQHIGNLIDIDAAVGAGLLHKMGSATVGDAEEALPGLQTGLGTYKTASVAATVKLKKVGLRVEAANDSRSYKLLDGANTTTVKNGGKSLKFGATIGF